MPFIVNTDWYGWNAPDHQIRKTRHTLVLLICVNLALSLICGLIPTGVTRHNWVSFAATAALVALGAELIGIIRFARAKNQMYQREFESVDHFIRLPCLFHMILTGVAVLAAVVSSISQWTGPLDLLALALLVGTFLCSFFVYKMYRALPTFTMKQPE